MSKRPWSKRRLRWQVTAVRKKFKVFLKKEKETVLCNFAIAAPLPHFSFEANLSSNVFTSRLWSWLHHGGYSNGIVFDVRRRNGNATAWSTLILQLQCSCKNNRHNYRELMAQNGDTASFMVHTNKMKGLQYHPDRYLIAVPSCRFYL